MALRAISLFSGVGGLDLGLRDAGVARTVCYVEREAHAAAVLVARMADGRLDEAPIWSDVCSFDGRPWRGSVDLVVGGFPCQDISSAGSRAGIIDGARSGLWREYARIVREVGPRFVFVENVGALLVRGVDVVLGDLAGMGFDAEWGVFRASDVGAPHRRERIFILADTDRRGLGICGRPERSRVERAPRDESDGRHPGSRAPWPPGRNDAAGWRDYLERHPGLEPALRRGTHGSAGRVDRLRGLGNAVVPDVAALAWETLMRRMTGGRP